MTSPVEWAILLGAAGVVLILLDLVVPSHGVLSVMGVLSFAGGIGVCFRINPWIGMAILITSLVLAPLAFHWFSHAWPKTKMARGLVLAPLEPEKPGAVPLAVHIGQVGRSISELRPAGVCEFGDVRVEAVSDVGMVRPGQRVEVIEIVNRRPVVRAVTSA
jgi:membrane-bound serine protease (ClpP class)